MTMSEPDYHYFPFSVAKEFYPDPLSRLIDYTKYGFMLIRSVSRPILPVVVFTQCFVDHHLSFDRNPVFDQRQCEKRKRILKIRQYRCSFFSSVISADPGRSIPSTWLSPPSHVGRFTVSWSRQCKGYVVFYWDITSYLVSTYVFL